MTKEERRAYDKERYKQNLDYHKLKNKKYREQNHERVLELNKEWYKNNKEYKLDYNKIRLSDPLVRKHSNKVRVEYDAHRRSLMSEKEKKEMYRNKNIKYREQSKLYRELHREEINERMKRYALENPERIKETRRKTRKKNIKRVLATNAKRRAAKLKRLPCWITHEEIEEIKNFYKNCPKGMVVDHIIPLLGKNISGFHCLKNLQYLTSQENLKKLNKFPYYPIQFYIDKGLIIGTGGKS